jgi:hypothetical protein
MFIWTNCTYQHTTIIGASKHSVSRRMNAAGQPKYDISPVLELLNNLWGLGTNISPVLELLNNLCRWFRFAQLAKGKKFRP